VQVHLRAGHLLALTGCDLIFQKSANELDVSSRCRAREIGRSAFKRLQ